MAKLLYLRRFKNLSVLNLAENPVCSSPDYRHYVIARVQNLRYLDYRLVDETTVHQLLLHLQFDHFASYNMLKSSIKMN